MTIQGAKVGAKKQPALNPGWTKERHNLYNAA